MQPQGTNSFAQGTLVELKALAAQGWEFSKWEGSVAETYSPETTVILDSGQTIKAIFIPTSEPVIVEAPGGIISRPRRSSGKTDIKYIMLHAISDAAANPSAPYNMWRIKAIFDDYGVESHYVIDREGVIYQFVKDDSIARHAGAGSWNNDPKLTNAMNRYAIGIELLGVGTRAEMKDVIGAFANTQIKADDRGYTQEQYLALEHLLHHLTELYEIPRENIITHQAYDPGRKWDPGALFDWNKINL